MDNDKYPASAGAQTSNGAIAANAESSVSSVVWSAVTGGALAAVSITVILMAVGSGLGLASVTPWPYAGPSLKTLTAVTAIWLVVVQWVSSAFGGYLTGRMRTKWAGIHDHEVFFRDTANGFLSWGLATLIGVVVLISLAAGMARGAANAGSNFAAVAARAGENSNQSTTRGDETSGPLAYLADSLFRPVPGHDSSSARAVNTAGSTARPVDAETTQEVTRILAAGVVNGDIPAGDKAYLGQLVAARTGMPQADAEKRVDDTLARFADLQAKARQAADAARKSGAYLALFTALAMVIGAFIAAAAAALGGHHRDQWSAELART